MATKGLDAITDLIDDVRTILAIIEELMAMKDDVSAWVDEQRSRLALFEELYDVVTGAAAA